MTKPGNFSRNIPKTLIILYKIRPRKNPISKGSDDTKLILDSSQWPGIRNEVLNQSLTLSLSQDRYNFGIIFEYFREKKSAKINKGFGSYLNSK